MKSKKLSILFVIKTSKQNKRGLCPINFRITYEKKRKEFSTGQFVNPKHWVAKLQCVLAKDKNSEYINAQLSLITQNIKNTYLKLQVQNIEFDLVDICNLYFGKERVKEETILSYYTKYLTKIRKLIGIDIKITTFKKFEYVKAFLEDFIAFKHNHKDVALNKLTLQFLHDFEYYLKTERNLGQATINKIIQRLRRPVKEAISEDYINKDPFILFKAKATKSAIIFLSPEELELFKKKQFAQPRLQLVKDLFIFCCYTGLAYNELSRLESKHIQKGFDNMLWITMKREKTTRNFSIPLLPQAESLLEKYKPKTGIVFPKISNQKYNSYLKEIGAILGIEKKLTTHIARKTFASTVLLYNDVPMKIVSELLGHASMKVTQDSYGKVVQQKISEQIIKLRNMKQTKGNY